MVMQSAVDRPIQVRFLVKGYNKLKVYFFQDVEERYFVDCSISVMNSILKGRLCEGNR